MRKCFLLVCLLPLCAAAQIGGRGAYSFLNIQPSARISSLGGSLMMLQDHDLNLAFQNPALLNKQMDNQLAMSYVNYFSDINIGNAAYAASIDSVSTFSVGLLYVNYGKFTATNIAGDVEGTFSAGDYSLQAGYSRQWRKWSYGANAKFIFSQLETYTSTGLALDLGANYHSDSSLFDAAILVKNAGLQLTSYNGSRENLPFEIQLGVAKKLRYAPFRFSVVAHNLQTLDISYINTNDRNRNINLETQEPEPQKISAADKIFRHFIVGSEIVFTKNFNIRVGYNHQRRQEMKMHEIRALSGFAWGFGLKISKLVLSYGSASFFPGKSTSQFSLTLNLNEFKRK